MDLIAAGKQAVNSLRAQRQLQAKYRAVFGTPDGETVLRHMCKKAHIEDSTFVQGDPYSTALNEGKRLFVLSVVKFLGKDISKMIQEAEKHNNEDSF